MIRVRKSILVSKPGPSFNYGKQAAGDQRPGFYGWSCSQMKSSFKSCLSHALSPQPSFISPWFTSTSFFPPAIHVWLATHFLHHYILSSSLLLLLNALSSVLMSLFSQLMDPNFPQPPLISQPSSPPVHYDLPLSLSFCFSSHFSTPFPSSYIFHLAFLSGVRRAFNNSPCWISRTPSPCAKRDYTNFISHPH